jgi:hypothetical protein
MAPATSNVEVRNRVRRALLRGIVGTVREFVIRDAGEAPGP